MTEIEEAARRGDGTFILQKLEQSPDLLTGLSSRNLAHIASKYGNHSVVMILLAQKPSLADERNEDGYCSIHLAAAHGYELVVLEHLKVKLNLCNIRDNNGWTPLHWATIKGRISVIRVLLQASVECIQSLTFRGESCLHLAVQYNQSEAFNKLICWLEQINYGDMEAMINLRERSGFAVLHHVVLRKQYQALETLISNRRISRALQINILDASGQTALDLYYHYSNHPDREIGEMLHASGAFRARRPRPLILYHGEDMNRFGRLERFGIGVDRVPVEHLGILLQFLGTLLVATLQAVSNNPFSSTEYSGEPRFVYVGDVLRGYGKNAQVLNAMVTNSISFIGSSILIQLLLILSRNFPFHIPLFILLLSMILYYFVALKNALPHFIIICGPCHIQSFWFVWIAVLTYGFTAFGVTAIMVSLARRFIQQLRRWSNNDTRRRDHNFLQPL